MEGAGTSCRSIAPSVLVVEGHNSVLLLSSVELVKAVMVRRAVCLLSCRAL